ncbi:MAG: biliverdin-producing heme oxygenase, partial [Pseudomonadota bacterium]|nr:biliverdin-producing heme oxygenase [Pseudomonadota bacterium]
RQEQRVTSTAARFALRAATTAHHNKVDLAFAVFDLGDRASYGRFLTVHARVLPLLEQSVGNGAAWTGWRPRAGELISDLDSLGLAAPPPLGPDIQSSVPAQWGVQYVLEGARLGGQVLAKRIANGAPSRYLCAPFDPAVWRNFLTELNAAGDAGEAGWLETASAAARAAFDLFERAVLVELETARG